MKGEGVFTVSVTRDAREKGVGGCVLLSGGCRISLSSLRYSLTHQSIIKMAVLFGVYCKYIPYVGTSQAI